MTQTENSHDLEAINLLTGRFFSLFCNKNGRQVRLDEIFRICIPRAIITRTCDGPPQTDSLEAFIRPRQDLLTNGRLVDFEEAEIEGTTRIFGAVAQRWCLFRKAGLMDGQAFRARGWKSIQYVKTPDGWKISAVAWDEEI